jgi:hypothetical protein
VGDGATLADILAGLANTDGVSISGTATGATVTLTSGGRVLDTVTIAVFGDVDGDGSVSTSDYMEMKSYVVTDELPHGVYARASDANGDGAITSLDLLLVSSYLSGVVKNIG